MIDLSYLPYKLKQEQLDALEFCLNRNEAIMSLGTGVKLNNILIIFS